MLKQATTGLVIGAGGASRAALYALYQLDIRDIFLVNRTISTAEKIARDFSALFEINVLPSLEVVETMGVRPDVVIGTIPADRTTVRDFPTALFVKGKGVCVDMAYKPRETPLLSVARGREGWVTVTGVEALLEQAVVQSELWLGVVAPKEEMAKALEESEQGSEAGESISWKL